MATAPAAAPPPMQGSVLYVEDDDANFALVQDLLSAHPGVRLARAHTGQQGVALAQRERPDVVLLDMRLPDITGTEVVRRLSEDIAAGRFRVILLTADTLNIDVLKAMSLGAFEYLIKPVDLRALQAAVVRALAAKALPQPGGPLRGQGR